MRALAEEFKGNQINNAALAERNAEISTALDILGRRKKALERDIASKTAELGRKHNELEGLQGTIESLGREQEELEAAIASELEEFTEVSELREALDAALSENSRLQQIVDHHAEMLFANANQIRALEKTIARLEDELRRAEKSNDSSSRDIQEKLRAAYTQLEEASSILAELPGQISRLGEELRLAQFENLALTRENEDLRSTLEDRDIRIVNLEGELDEARGYKHEFLIRKRALELKEDQLREAEELIEAKSKAIHHLQQNNIRQAQRLEQLAADNAGYQRAHKAACFEITRLEGLLESFKETNRKLRAELAIVSDNLEYFAEEARKAGKDNEVLTRKITKLTSEKASLETALHEAEADERKTYYEMVDIARDRQAINKKKLEVEQEAARLTEENRGLTQELNELRREHYNLQTDNELLRDELASLRSELAERDATIQEAAEMGSHAVASLKAAEYANAKLKDDNADLASGYDLAQREKSDLAAKLRAQALELEAAKAQVVSQAALLEQAKEEIFAEQKRAREALAQKDITIRSLEGQVSELTSTNEAQARQIQALQEQNAALGLQITGLDRSIASKDLEIDSADEQLRQIASDKLITTEAFEKQIQGLRASLDVAGKDNAALKASTERQIAELQEAKKDAAAAFEARILELTSTIEASKQDKLRLEQYLGELRTQKESLTAQLAAATSTIGSLERDNGALREQLAARVAEIETLTSEIARLEEVGSRKDSEILSITEQLSALRAEKDDALDKLTKEREMLFLRQLKEAEAERARLAEIVSKDQLLFITKEDEIKDLQRRNSILDKELAATTDRLNQQLRALETEMEKRAAAFNKQIFALDHALGIAQRENAVLKANLQRLEEKKD